MGTLVFLGAVGCIDPVAEISPSGVGEEGSTGTPMPTTAGGEETGDPSTSDPAGTGDADGMDSTTGDDPSTSGGTTTSTTEGDTGGEDAELHGEEVLVRHRLDAEPGSTPGFIEGEGLDGAFPLALDYDGVLSWTEDEAGRRGLTWSEVGAGGLAFAAASETSLANLDGATQATIEVVCEVANVMSQGSRIVHVGGGGDSGDFTLFATDLSEVSFRLASHTSMDRTAEWNYSLDGGRTVFHLVFDSSAADPQDRVRLYANGEPLDASFMIEIPQDASIELDASAIYALGNRSNGGRSMQGTIYYAAIYGEALGEDDVQNNADLLLGDD